LPIEYLPYLAAAPERRSHFGGAVARVWIGRSCIQQADSDDAFT